MQVARVNLLAGVAHPFIAHGEQVVVWIGANTFGHGLKVHWLTLFFGDLLLPRKPFLMTYRSIAGSFRSRLYPIAQEFVHKFRTGWLCQGFRALKGVVRDSFHIDATYALNVLFWMQFTLSGRCSAI